jgi:hypothetical protein
MQIGLYEAALSRLKCMRLAHLDSLLCCLVFMSEEMGRNMM